MPVTELGASGPLSPTLARAVAQLRAGRPVILCDAGSREDEGDLAFAAGTCTPELVNFTLSNARGVLCISMPPETAARIGVQRLAANGGDPMGTPFGYPVSVVGHGSGVSATSRCATIRAVADEASRPEDFAKPGHIATLIAHPGGVRARDGHTEAILDLLRIAGIPGPGVLCEILAPSGEIAGRAELAKLSEEHGLPILDIAEVVAHLALADAEAT